MTTSGVNPARGEPRCCFARVAIAVLFFTAAGAPELARGFDGIGGLKGWQWLLIMEGSGTLGLFAMLWMPWSTWLGNVVASDSAELVNSIANIAGSGGPCLIGGINETGRISAGLLALGVLVLGVLGAWGAGADRLDRGFARWAKSGPICRRAWGGGRETAK
jgi:hypothetical protein